MISETNHNTRSRRHLKAAGISDSCRCVHTFGRKRVVPNYSEGSPWKGSSHKCRSRRLSLALDTPNHLESLPPEILTKIICCVHHSDLKYLFCVSKTIREAALIAMNVHFAYTTPSSKSVFKEDTDSDNVSDTKPPNAPRRANRCKSFTQGRQLGSIAVVLFPSEKEEE